MEGLVDDSHNRVDLDEENHLNYAAEQGLDHICGYIAFKLQNKFPFLGSKERTESSSKWTAVLSCGGLYYPSQEFASASKQFDAEFEKFHGGTLS